MRKGMWVVHDDRIAIIFDKDEDAALIHYVDDRGETSGQRIVPLSDLRQAKLDEIPGVRRPSPELADKFGYA